MNIDLRRVRAFLPRGMASLMGSNAASMVVSLAAVPLIARWYRVSDLGVYQIYATTMTVGSMVSCARFDYAILLPAEELIARRLCLLAAFAALASGAVTALALPVISGFLKTAGWEALGNHNLIVGITVAVTGMGAAMTQWRIRSGHFHVIARARVAQSLITAVLQVAGAFAGIGGVALILGDVIGRVLNLGALTPLKKPRSTTEIWLAITELPMLMRSYIRFPLISSPSALINAAGFSLPIFILERCFGTRIVGLYSLMDRVLGMPSTLAGTPLTQVFMHRFRAVTEQGSIIAVKEIHDTVRISALIGLIPFGMLAIAGPQLFILVFGAKWHDAGYLAQFASLPYFVGHVFSPSMPTLIILNKLRTQLLWDIGRVVLMVFSCWLMVSLGGGPNQLVLTIPSVLAVMYVTHYFLCINAARGL